MGTPPTTPAERVEVLRQMINGSLQPAAAVTYRNENYLLGVALHAIVRKNKGKALSQIEQIMYDYFTTGAADEAEIREYGNVYTEAKRAAVASGASVFPDTVLQLGDEEERPRSDSYTAAVAQAGRGTSVLFSQSSPRNMTPNSAAAASSDTVSADEPVQASSSAIAASSTRIRLVLSRFKCHKKSGELGKDEIYWGLASGADTQDKLVNSQITREYGSIRSGDTRVFDSGTVLFDGQVNNSLAVHIQCWEADHSTSRWYDQLRKALKATSEATADWTSQWGPIGNLVPLIPGVGEFDELLFWTSQITGLISMLLDKFRNHDDLVAEKSIVFSRQALNWFLEFPNSEASFMFDGGKGGVHELWIRRELGLDPNDDTIGRLKTRRSRQAPYDVKESPETLGPARSFYGMSLVDYKGELWGFFSRSHSNQVCYSVWDGLFWGPIRPVGDNYGNSKPVAATLGDTVHVLYSGGDGRVLHVQYVPATKSWSDTTAVGGNTLTWDYPAIAGFEDKLVAIHRGDGPDVYYSVKAPNSAWTGWTKLRLTMFGAEVAISFRRAPVLCWYRDRLYLWSVVGPNNRLACYPVTFSDGRFKLGPSIYVDDSWTEYSSPAVAADQDAGMMYVFHHRGGSRQAMWMSTFLEKNDASWGVSGEDISSRVKSIGEPGTCMYDGKLWLAYADRLS